MPDPRYETSPSASRPDGGNPYGTSSSPAESSLINYTHLIYALHSIGLLMGVFSTATTVVGGFVFSIPSIIAVIMNYVRRSDVRGTFLDSHFSWQIRTFWFTLLWSAILAIVSVPLMLIAIGFVTWFVGCLVLGAWVIYRMARGWLALRDRRPMYT